MKKKLGIIGAGPSGLSLNLFLEEEAEILEKCPQVGGFASSFTKDGFTFDHGPHILFSKNKPILDFIVEALGDNVHQCRRNNKVSFKNRLIKYPFENDLKSLPLEDNFECLYHFINNPYKSLFRDPQNLKEWLLKTFGQGICERYLFPYNEKVWNIPVEELSMIWAERIPQPPLVDVIKSALGYETEGYLHQLYYHYPLRGGYQAISETLARNQSVVLDTEVQEIFPTQDGRLSVTGGKTRYTYDEIISTMPVQELIRRLKLKIPEEVKTAVSKLVVNPIIIISLGIQGRDEKQLTAIYFPETDFWVNRISFPCTFSPHNGPPNHYSIQAEITCRRNSEIWQKNDEEILDHVTQGLLSRGLLPSREAVVSTDVRRKNYAYVVYDRGYEENVAVMRHWFQSQKIHLLGRFSFFEYINIDGAVERALEIANRLNHQKQDPKELLSRGLMKIKKGS